MAISLSVGSFLKTKRIKKNLTLEQVANCIGVSKGTVSRWENNEIESLKANRVKTLCECLDISIVDFIELCSKKHK